MTTCRVDIKHWPAEASTIEEAISIAEMVDDEKFVIPQPLSWGDHKQPLLTLSYLQHEAYKKDKEWAELMDRFSRHLPVDCSVCAMHRTAKGKIYFSVDSRPAVMGDAKEHLRSKKLTEKQFLASIAPVAKELMRSGTRCMAMVQHIVKQAPPSTAWQRIVFNNTEGLTMFYYAAHMLVAMALGAFLLTHMRRVAMKDGVSQVNILASYSTRAHRPSSPKRKISRGAVKGGGGGDRRREMRTDEDRRRGRR